MIIKNKTNRFLIFSIVVIIITCLIVFGVLINATNRKNAEMIGNIVSIYMEEMNRRIAAHLDTVIDLKLSGAEEMTAMDPPENFSSYDTAAAALEYSARTRDFTYLGFSCGNDIVTVYGPEALSAIPENFHEAIKEGNSIMTAGKDQNGGSMIIIGVPAEYELDGGKRSDAVIVGLDTGFMDQVLSVEHTEDILVYSMLIRRDGSFVLADDQDSETYFDKFMAQAMEYDGKMPEDNVSEMKSAIAAGESYSSTYKTAAGTGHVYFTALPGTEWYLVTVMPYGKIDETISDLNSDWIDLVIISCSSMLLVLLIIFVIYYNMSSHQMKELEKARAEALHATKAKSEFLSNMSHDIRTPMNAIVGMTAIAGTNIDDKQQVQNCLNKIALSSKHLLGLINDILDMSKIESGKMTLNMEQISLREVIDSIVSIVQPQAKSKHQSFEVSIHDIISEDVYCDSVRLNQVLLNLLSNAVKFTPDNGAIRISVYEAASPLGETHVRVFIEVKDNGIGMSPEFQKHVFETFVREDSSRVRKTEGTGLGMPITKYIVEAMGGTIECESEQGKGTSFHVTVDLEKALVREEDMILPNWDMLVVDDDDQLCRSAVKALEEIGINAEWTLDGESAVRMAEERHLKGRAFQIVLLDWKLPGIDGIETAKQIRKKVGDDVPILLISAYDWSEIETEARSAGINGFIAKPLFKSTLYYGLKEFMIPEGKTEEIHEKKIDLTGHRILLAEDNDLNWEIADALLEEIGLEIDRAENGRQCVDKFKESEVGRYDAILMDIRMPVMTGYEAAEAIRALDRDDFNIPIIAMTADAFAEDVKKCIESGMNAHVAKPIDIDEVAKVLEKYIKE